MSVTAKWTCIVCEEEFGIFVRYCTCSNPNVGEQHRVCLDCSEQWMSACIDTMTTPNLVFPCPGPSSSGKCTFVLPTESSGNILWKHNPNLALFPKAQAYLKKQNDLAQAHVKQAHIHQQLIRSDKDVIDDATIFTMAHTILVDNEVMKCTFCACPFDAYTGCNAVKCQGYDGGGDAIGCGSCFCGICGVSLNASASSSTSADSLAHTHAAYYHSDNRMNYFSHNASMKQVAATLLRTQQVAEAILRHPINLHHRLLVACISKHSSSSSSSVSELWDFTCLTTLVSLRLMRPNVNTPAPALKYFFGQLPKDPYPPNDMTEWFARTTYKDFMSRSQVSLSSSQFQQQPILIAPLDPFAPFDFNALFVPHMHAHAAAAPAVQAPRIRFFWE